MILEFSNRVALVLRLERQEGAVEEYHSLSNISVSMVAYLVRQHEKKTDVHSLEISNLPIVSLTDRTAVALIEDMKLLG